MHLTIAAYSPQPSNHALYVTLFYLERVRGIEPTNRRLTVGCPTLGPLGNNLVRIEGLEPPRLAAPEPKSGASTNFAISA